MSEALLISNNLLNSSSSVLETYNINNSSLFFISSGSSMYFDSKGFIPKYGGLIKFRNISFKLEGRGSSSQSEYVGNTAMLSIGTRYNSERVDDNLAIYETKYGIYKFGGTSITTEIFNDFFIYATPGMQYYIRILIKNINVTSSANSQYSVYAYADEIDIR